jgi:hypothetical protein
MAERDRGSTIPLILGFFVIALAMIGASIALGQAFVQQRELQSICDGAVAAAAAGGGDLDREADLGAEDSLRFADVAREVTRYLARDESRARVTARATLSHDRTRITLRCRQRLPLAFGRYFGRGHVTHTATSTGRAAVTP